VKESRSQKSGVRSQESGVRSCRSSGVAGVQELQNDTALFRSVGGDSMKISTRLPIDSKPVSVPAMDICILNSCNFSETARSAEREFLPKIFTSPGPSAAPDS